MGERRRTAPGLPARLREISRLLSRRFGRPDACGHEIAPVRNLVLTILSQNTTDANRDRAYGTLMRRFPPMTALANAKPPEVEEAIRVGGLAKAKARSILGALSRLKEERGDYSLAFLRSMPLPAARAYLTSFPGIGVKTAGRGASVSDAFRELPTTPTMVINGRSRSGLPSDRR